MAEYRKIFLSVNPELASIVDPATPDTAAASASFIPSVYNGETVIFCVSFIDSSGQSLPQSSGDVFELSIDCDFIHEDDPLMAYSTLSNQPGDWEDASPEDGKISLRVPCSTIAFNEKLQDSESKKAWMEIKKISPGSSDVTVMLLASITAKNVLHLDESEPEPSDPLYYTRAQVDALLKAKQVYQFSENGTDSWHDVYSSEDRFYRERKNIDGSEWSDALPLGRSELIVDTLTHSFQTAAGQAAAVTFQKSALGIASDSEPQVSLWSVDSAAGTRTKIADSSYLCVWNSDSLVITYYQAWAEGSWCLKFS